ncbi:ferritin-like domain-containing protein [Actinokineospora auranticolor]|uniref:Ferritin-like domain-containing protein n=1 Tax=Actinokineospora auranticolor TaxID=155976 RepID=A0A2S6GCD3_9PSEU|nr:ferritin-like domain-containing protein [Actinokineospora auranticolor]PPK62215.1 hypothetical protein CLV40_13626 [Actinokineospora auranticolor]
MNDREWLRHFTEEVAHRAARPEPDWSQEVCLHPAVIRSIQRFQVGEDGDGTNLIAKAGDGDYGATVKLFIAEEQNHARMLANLLKAADTPTIASHWTDAAFVWLRRALGLRLQLMVLTIAEVVALVFYRALRDGTTDKLTTEVARRILADERRHVPFHRDRLRSLGGLPWVARAGWRLLFFGATLVVLLDHGSAMRVLGVSRSAFLREAMTEFTVASDLPAVTKGRAVQSVG